MLPTVKFDVDLEALIGFKHLLSKRNSSENQQPSKSVATFQCKIKYFSTLRNLFVVFSDNFN